MVKRAKRAKKINLKIGKIDLDELSKYITQMKKEGRYFEKGDADYEESLKHPMGIPKIYGIFQINNLYFWNNFTN